MYGYTLESDTLVFTPEGKLIGGKEEFFQEVLKKYEVKYEFGKNLFEVSKSMNHMRSEEEFQLRGKETLPLKIERVYAQAKKSGLLGIENQEFFEAGTSQGEILMVKYSRFLTPEMVIPKVFEIEKESKYRISDPQFDLGEALKKDSNFEPKGLEC